MILVYTFHKKKLFFRPSKIHLQRLFVFSLVWGLGALLETADRSKFHSYLNNNFSSILDLPSSKNQPDAEIFDFFVTEEGLGYNYNFLKHKLQICITLRRVGTLEYGNGFQYTA